MASLTMNQIHKEYVGETTPFRVWLNIEKELYRTKKGKDPDKDKDGFNFYMNSRYRAGGTELWKRHLDKVASNFEGERGFNESGNMKNVHNIQDVKIDKEPAKGSLDEKETAAPNLPFLKRKALGMPMPLTLGLGAITIFSIGMAVTATVKYVKNKKSE